MGPFALGRLLFQLQNLFVTGCATVGDFTYRYRARRGRT